MCCIDKSAHLSTTTLSRGRTRRPTTLQRTLLWWYYSNKKRLERQKQYLQRRAASAAIEQNVKDDKHEIVTKESVLNIYYATSRWSEDTYKFSSTS